MKFRGQDPSRRSVVAAAAALLFLLVSCTLSANGADGDPIYVLNAYYTPEVAAKPQIEATLEGLHAALSANNYMGANNRPIQLIEQDDVGNDGTSFAQYVTAALAKYPDMLTIIGPYADMRLVEGLQSGVLTANNLVCVAPYTGSSTVRMWTKNFYFLRAEPEAELLLLLKHTVNILRARRVGYMYLTGVSFGDTELTTVQTQLANAGHEPATVYRDAFSYTTPGVNETGFEALASSYPQAIILWGQPGTQLVAFMKRILTDPRTSKAVLLAPVGLQDLLYTTYSALADAGALRPVDGQLITSGTSMLPNDSRGAHLKLFKTDMDNYIASGNSRYDTTVYEDDPGVGELLVGGWLVGQMLVQLLNRGSWITDRVAFQNGLFEQNRYTVGTDFILGDFGGDCDAMAEALGATCQCNQGGHTTFLKENKGVKVSPVESAYFTYPHTDCYASKYSMPRPINELGFIFTDDAAMEQMGKVTETALQAAAEGVDSTVLAFNAATTEVTASTVQEVLDATMQNCTLDIITGPIAPALKTGDILVVDPIFAKPRVHSSHRTTITLTPTVEQQIFGLYSYLATGRSLPMGRASVSLTPTFPDRIRAVLRGLDADQNDLLQEVITKTAVTFGVENAGFAIIRDSDNLASSLKKDGLSLLLGLTTGDAATIVSFLGSNSKAGVMLVSPDFGLYYDELVAALASAADESISARVLFQTNLPLWADTSDEALQNSEVLSLFNDAFPDPAQKTYPYLRMFVDGLFLESIVASTTTVSSAAMADTIYRNGVVTVHGMSFGQYRWSCSETEANDNMEDCDHVNYGARGMDLFSMQRVTDPSVPSLVVDYTPVVVYSDPNANKKSGLSTGQLVGIIVGSIAGGLLLIAAIVLLWLFCCGPQSRNNSAAPRKNDEAVTLLFTDIESSTALWAALPQIMPEAVATHHRLIRQAIKKFNCYEVKTIGDSFMIACKNAHAGVQLAADIQTRLLKYDWKTADIDFMYRNFEMKKEESPDNDDYKAPTAHLSPEAYGARWNGLRVRIGVHTGLSDIRHDEVTKGYDYYGDTSNMAARTEAVANGGQVLLTESTWWALSNEERSSFSFTNMGPQGLRGVPYAVEMYQLNPVEGREHAALRTEIEAILPDDFMSQCGSSGADALLSSTEALSGPAMGIASVLTSCFSPYTATQRIKELQPLLAKWSVPVPPQPKSVSDEDYCQGLINRLALRMSTVMQAKDRMNGIPDAIPGASTTATNVPRAGNPLSMRGAESRPVSQQGRSPVQDPPPPVITRSAMRESRVNRRSLMNDSHVSPLVLFEDPEEEEELEEKTAVGEDEVVQFHESRLGSNTGMLISVTTPSRDAEHSYIRMASVRRRFSSQSHDSKAFSMENI